MELARSMLKYKGLPDRFWAEAVACAIYILNRSFTRSLDGKTPQEAWSKIKPSVSHLRGCTAYSHVPDVGRSKLDDRSEKCIFVGYSETSKAYKLFNPITNKVVISKDVIFMEDKSWDWSQEINGSSAVILDEEILQDEQRDNTHDEGQCPTPTSNLSPNSYQFLHHQLLYHH